MLKKSCFSCRTLVARDLCALPGRFRKRPVSTSSAAGRTRSPPRTDTLEPAGGGPAERASKAPGVGRNASRQEGLPRCDWRHETPIGCDSADRPKRARRVAPPQWRRQRSSARSIRRDSTKRSRTRPYRHCRRSRRTAPGRIAPGHRCWERASRRPAAGRRRVCCRRNPSRPW